MYFILSEHLFQFYIKGGQEPYRAYFGMKYEEMTKEQLILELRSMEQKVEELSQLQADHERLKLATTISSVGIWGLGYGPE